MSSFTFVYHKLDNSHDKFNAKRFLGYYLGPIIFFFVVFTILYLTWPLGWYYTCNKKYKIEAGPTYSSVFLALPLVAIPGYGKLSTRLYGTFVASASFAWWGTNCAVAHSLDVISASFYPLFLWEALTFTKPYYKFVFFLMVCILSPLLYEMSIRDPWDVPYNLGQALIFTGTFSAVMVLANCWITKRWKKEAATVVIAVTAGALLYLRWGKVVDEKVAVRYFGTTSWGHILAGIALYTASVNTDIYMD